MGPSRRRPGPAHRRGRTGPPPSSPAPPARPRRSASPDEPAGWYGPLEATALPGQQTKWRGVVAGAVAVAVLLGVGGTVGGWLATHQGSARPASHALASDHHVPPTTTTTIAPTAPGPDGTTAAWVKAENAKPGTTAWKITGTPPGTIAGYANVTSATVGQRVTLYVTTNASTLHVDAYRMGWYGGDGARLVWTSPTVSGQRQPNCPVTSGTNMVACDNWSPTLGFTVSSAFVQGDYLLELYGSGGQRSYVPLTVTDPSSTATYLLKADTFTWQAWNPYGGYDLYQGLGSCAPSYPPCNRARVVSYDRPYGYADGAGDFIGNELPLVEYVERHGLAVAYTTDVDVEQDPAILARHATVLSLGHDECWSLTEREAAQRAVAHGTNMVFFGASAILRHVRMQSSPLGPDREEVDYRDAAEDPLDGKGNPLEVTGNWWGDPPTSWPATGFVGEAYSGFLVPGATPQPMVVVDPSAWLFDGMHLHDGSTIPGVLVSDFDQVNPNLHPSDLQVLTHSPIPSADSESQVSPTYADTTYYSDAKSGAGVFDTGTVAWIPDLAHNSAVAQMTGNLFRVFDRARCGKTFPSVANWQRYAVGQVAGS